MDTITTDSGKVKIIQELAMRLIETLGNMPSDKADAVVRDVATSLMNDVLGKKGYISSDTKAILCGSFGAKRLESYEWMQL